MSTGIRRLSVLCAAGSDGLGLCRMSCRGAVRSPRPEIWM